MKYITFLLSVFVVSGCSLFLEYKEYDIVDRRMGEQSVYQHEHKYIMQRRKVAKISKKQKNIGLAFSGGGIRSATFNLGVLQLLEKKEFLKHVDYLSTVSGGSYIGAWYVGHLANKKEEHYHRKGWLQFTSDPKKLLLNPSQSAYGGMWKTSDQITHLRNASGFLLEDTSGVNWFLRWFARFIPHTVTSLVGIKIPKGKVNPFSVFYLYEEAINKAYIEQKGNKRIYLHDINPPGSVAPYLIINATLGNWGSTNNRFFSKAARKDGVFYHQPFEFTRDYCGSPATGYVETKGFNKTVSRVYSLDDFTQKYTSRDKKFPTKVEVIESEEIPLSYAVAASGAATDATVIGQDGGIYDSLLGIFVLEPIFNRLNLTVRLETPNFSQDFSEIYLSPIDRSFEFTANRVLPCVRSNTLHIADGGFYDNLGIVALVKRKVANIIAFDVTADPGYYYSDLKRAIKYISFEGCSSTCEGYKCTFEKFPSPGNAVSKGKIECECRQKTSLNLYYCKSTFPIGKELPPFLKRYSSYPKNNNFPHTSTLFQWFDWEKFEGYKQLGYFVASFFYKQYGKDLNKGNF